MLWNLLAGEFFTESTEEGGSGGGNPYAFSFSSPPVPSRVVPMDARFDADEVTT